MAGWPRPRRSRPCYGQSREDHRHNSGRRIFREAEARVEKPGPSLITGVRILPAIAIAHPLTTETHFCDPVYIKTLNGFYRTPKLPSLLIFSRAAMSLSSARAIRFFMGPLCIFTSGLRIASASKSFPASPACRAACECRQGTNGLGDDVLAFFQARSTIKR